MTIPNVTKFGHEEHFLLNPFLIRTIFFYKLTTKAGTDFYFNTKSSFYDFEEYQINTKLKFRNDWYKS